MDEQAAGGVDRGAGDAGAGRDIDGQCVTVVASKDKSGNAALRAANGFTESAPELRPTVWVPDSTSWLSMANASGATAVPAKGIGIAESAIVLAMPAPLAFGDPEERDAERSEEHGDDRDDRHLHPWAHGANLSPPATPRLPRTAPMDPRP